jgi:hypothetical protein
MVFAWVPGAAAEGIGNEIFLVLPLLVHIGVGEKCFTRSSVSM